MKNTIIRLNLQSRELENLLHSFQKFWLSKPENWQENEEGGRYSGKMGKMQDAINSLNAAIDTLESL